MSCLRVLVSVVIIGVYGGAHGFFVPSVSTRQVCATRRSLVPLDQQQSLLIAARGPESIQEDPFLVGLALSSIALLVFVTGGTIFLTAAEQRDPLKQPEKPKLPTLSELEKDPSGNGVSSSEGSNRYSRRMQKKRAGKRQKSDNPF